MPKTDATTSLIRFTALLFHLSLLFVFLPASGLAPQTQHSISLPLNRVFELMIVIIKKQFHSDFRINLGRKLGIINHTSHPHVMPDGTVYNLGMAVYKTGPRYCILKFPPKSNSEYQSWHWVLLWLQTKRIVSYDRDRYNVFSGTRWPHHFLL